MPDERIVTRSKVSDYVRASIRYEEDFAASTDDRPFIISIKGDNMTKRTLQPWILTYHVEYHDTVNDVFDATTVHLRVSALDAATAITLGDALVMAERADDPQTVTSYALIAFGLDLDGIDIDSDTIPLRVMQHPDALH